MAPSSPLNRSSVRLWVRPRMNAHCVRAPQREVDLLTLFYDLTRAPCELSGGVDNTGLRNPRMTSAPRVASLAAVTSPGS